jgi:hypothetical protein
MISTHARSLYSTPERRVDISEDVNEDQKDDSSVTKINDAKSVIRTRHGHHGSNRRKKGRSSGKHHHSTHNSVSGINIGG